MCAKGTAHFLTSPKIPDAKGIFVMIQFTPVGDSGVLAVCGSEISEQVNAQVMALDAAVQAAQLLGVVETVPTYAALLVTLDPLQTDADTLIPALRRLWDALPPVSSTAAGRLVEVPVCYGGDYGPDLAFVAQHAGLTEQQVIDIHCGRDYRIFMLGFLPGFPYLGGMDERIVCPRLQTPRTKIPAGDSGVLAVCGSEISEQVNAQVMALDAAVQAAQLLGVVETVPTYAALLVTLDPLQTDADTLIPALRRLWDALPPVSSTAAGRLVEVPVCYGGDYGPDLAFVAQHAGLTEQQVIDIHCGRDYRIFMLGFLPGFPYLGGMDERIVCPRLQTPRTKIPAGAVGIGGKQTGIYPLASPGGWQLIGRTPLRLFDPAGGGKLPYAAGDRIRFVPISPEKFEIIQKEQGAAL